MLCSTDVSLSLQPHLVLNNHEFVNLNFVISELSVLHEANVAS